MGIFRESCKSLQRLAHDLGVNSNSLREWAKRSNIAEGAGPGLAVDERADLNWLRREVKMLREALDL